MRNTRFYSAFAAAVFCSLAVSGQELVREKVICVPDEPANSRGIVRTPKAVAELDEFGNTVYKINANEPWRRTEVEVRRGQRVKITASGIARWASDGAGWTVVNANGRGGWSSSRVPLPDGAIGSLVMRIGKGVYAAGTSVIVEAEDDGVVEFRMNDDVIGDNSGHFWVRVIVQPG